MGISCRGWPNVLWSLLTVWYHPQSHNIRESPVIHAVSGPKHSIFIQSLPTFDIRVLICCFYSLFFCCFVPSIWYGCVRAVFSNSVHSYWRYVSVPSFDISLLWPSLCIIYIQPSYIRLVLRINNFFFIFPLHLFWDRDCYMCCAGSAQRSVYLRAPLPSHTRYAVSSSSTYEDYTRSAQRIHTLAGYMFKSNSTARIRYIRCMWYFVFFEVVVVYIIMPFLLLWRCCYCCGCYIYKKKNNNFTALGFLELHIWALCSLCTRALFWTNIALS